MILDSNDEETDALEKLLRGTIDGDPHPLSPRIQTLKAILAKIQPEPAHAPLPPPEGVCATVSNVAALSRRAGRSYRIANRTYYLDRTSPFA